MTNMIFYLNGEKIDYSINCSEIPGGCLPGFLPSTYTKNKFHIDQKFKYQYCKAVLHEIIGELFFDIIMGKGLSRYTKIRSSRCRN